MDDTFRTQWTITPHLPDESSALVDETHRHTHSHPLIGPPIFVDFVFYIESGLIVTHLVIERGLSPVF